MLTSYFSTLFEFHRWANDHVLTALRASQLTKPANTPDIHNVLGHIFHAGAVWQSRITGTPLTSVDLWAPMGLHEALEANEAEHERWRNIILQHDAEQFQRVIAYTNLQGVAYENRVSEILGHAVNHATHHRSQLLERAKKHGATTINVDFISYARRHPSPTTAIC